MAKKNKPLSFKAAVKATPDIAACFQEGLRGLEARHRRLVTASANFEGSVDIDACTREKYPNESRWDYAIGVRGQACFIEVHTANTHEVAAVLKKLAWLKNWLIREAPELNRIKAGQHTFVWIQSSDYHILPSSPQSRKLIQAGLKPVPRLTL